MQHAAADGQEELFMKAVEWDDAYKISYGGPLFANHLTPFFQLAGLDVDDAGRRGWRPARRPRSGGSPTSSAAGAQIWSHFGATEGALSAGRGMSCDD